MMIFRVKQLACFITGTAMAFGMQCGFASAAAKNIQVKSSYVRAVIPGQKNSAAYFSLENNSKKPHTLVNVISPIAEKVQIHVSLENKGVAKMRRVSEVSLAEEQRTVLEPGGIHVMLMGLATGLQLGDTVPLTLVYEDGSSYSFDAPVRGLIGQADHNHTKHHHDAS